MPPDREPSSDYVSDIECKGKEEADEVEGGKNREEGSVYIYRGKLPADVLTGLSMPRK